ncbi:MAG: hypothetical protein WAU36_08970 [Cyclobacteriaceae bacterium]
MKTRRQLTMIAIFGAVLSLTAFSVYDTPRHDAPESEFLILISDTDNGLQLVCEEGCVWTALSFSLKEGKQQLIDQYGMASQERPSQNEITSNFLLSIQRTEAEFHLEGKKGTSWTVLNFSCPSDTCSQYIDQNGMTTKK